jgi:hypothetical protein
VTNIIRTHLHHAEQAVAAVPPCALRSLLLLCSRVQAGALGSRGDTTRVYFNTAAVDVENMDNALKAGFWQSAASCCSGCFSVPRIGARTRAAAAGPPRRPT